MNIDLKQAEKETVTEAIDDIAFHSHELVNKCTDLATFLIPDTLKCSGEIRRTARLAASLVEAIENAFGNLPRIDES